ncbi:hypothetical protein CNMCM8980_000783 [Aspergillus fumigatiaffinis]|nr:hypothetical protein CNMCM5878_000825 [Aspergillus fumigatiaffinis]KAF4250415.1 hypothetical protein CNMCM8980_000783 [Aspergillus fumigatiaffinis]
MSRNQPSYSFLLSIPAEILYLIYGGLDRQSLLQLAGTCRMFHGLCVPLIYRMIEDCAATVGTDTDMGDAAVTQQRSPARLKAFPLLLTLLRNPTIANQVEQISTLEMTTSHLQHDTDFLLAKTDPYSVPNPKFTLHHLRSITIRLELKNYVNTTPANTDSIDISRINGLLHCAPNLASLTIYNASGSSSLTAQLPCLTSLRLIDSYLEGEGLKALTASCRRLMHFELACSIFAFLLPRVPSTAIEVLGCLAPSKHKLRRLLLQIEPYYMHREPVADSRFMGLETLGAFSTLQQLTIDDRLLVRKGKSDDAALVRLIEDCPTLEGLHLVGVSNLSADELACFARAVESGRWPKLSKLKIQSRRRMAPPARRAIEESWQRFSAMLQSDLAAQAMDILRSKRVIVTVVSGFVPTSPFADD